MEEGHFFKMKVNVDRFEHKTITQTEDYRHDYFLKLGFRHFSEESEDSLYFYIDSDIYDVPETDESSAIFLIDGTRTVKVKGAGRADVVSGEYHADVLCEISKDQLKEICDAKTLEIRLNIMGEERTIIPSNFIVFAQCFYNQFLDANEYKDALLEYDKVGEKLAEDKRRQEEERKQERIKDGLKEAIKIILWITIPLLLFIGFFYFIAEYC